MVFCLNKKAVKRVKVLQSWSSTWKYYTYKFFFGLFFCCCFWTLINLIASKLRAAFSELCLYQSRPRCELSCYQVENLIEITNHQNCVPIFTFSVFVIVFCHITAKFVFFNWLLIKRDEYNLWRSKSRSGKLDRLENQPLFGEEARTPPT